MAHALVLEGGGARGAFQAGVLLYLHDRPERFRTDLVCGTSVGALNAAAFAFGLVPELVATWCRLTNAQVYRRRSPLRHLLSLLVERRFTNLYDTEPLQRLLERVFRGLRMSDCPLQLRISAFNLQTGRIQDFGNDCGRHVHEVLRASTALQALFPPMALDGFQYVDGANGSNLPLRPALRAGATRILVVRSAPGTDNLTPWPYRDMLSIQKRAHLSLMGRLTTSDLARAREVSRALTRMRRERSAIRRAAASLVDPFERERMGAAIGSCGPVLPGRRAVQIRILEPPPEAPKPGLLDFDPETSLELLRLGYAEAQRCLEPTREVTRHVRP